MSAISTRDFDFPFAGPLKVKGEVRKPSQAEGERNQPGDEQRTRDSDPDFAPPEKPSQAEGERKPYQ
jgi:hypothetical protein